ncbi:MAG TPA: polyphenol oxidase family protein [Gemmatimonadales bacterium]|nr:polyphenol oxidase family protein [Gemmatimonadales bacterium]
MSVEHNVNTQHPAPLPLQQLAETPAGDAAVPRLELAEWAERYGIVAGITTRPLSLGLWSDEPVGQVIGRWRAFRTAFGARFPSIVLAHQVHGTDVHWHDALQAGWLILDGIDGHATTEPGVLLTVTVADCVPVYLAVPRKNAVALIHAGWRGTADGILEQCVELLKWRAFAKASDVVMHCGVGICGGCYEVGSEVAVRFGMTGTVKVDLRAVLVQQARTLGIEAISTSPWCSAEGKDRFFSHRASRGRDGRMVAYLGRPLG